MRTLESQDEIQKLLADRPERTETFRIRRELLATLPRDWEKLRKLDAVEVDELGRYLEVDASELEGPFRVVDMTCGNCGRRVGFVDFAKTAVDHAHHDKAQLRTILTGNGDAWLTIRGRDGGRSVICANCDRAILTVNGDYSEYDGGKNYAYA